MTNIEWRGNHQKEQIAIHEDFEQKKQLVVQATQFMNVQYEVSVTIRFEEKTYVYKAYTQVKIDRQSPIVYEDDINIDGKTKYGISIVKTEYIPGDLKVETKDIKYVTNDEIEEDRILNIFKDKKVGCSTIKALCYHGVVQETKQWGEIDTYGGKLTENIVQAISRDLLGNSMLNLEAAGYHPVCHIHDECLVEVPAENAKEYYDEMARIMSIPPEWASDLPLRADGYVTPFYLKD